jgi:hypothetical protein
MNNSKPYDILEILFVVYSELSAMIESELANSERAGQTA